MKIRYGPDGIHVFKKDTGLNVLFDELIIPKHQWSKAPRNISIALTNACDLSCSFCYAPKESASLDYNTLLVWLVKLDKNGCLGVGFGGGEPTLYKHLLKLCEFLSTETELAVTMTTHGHRLDSYYLAKLNGNINFIRVSMDGVYGTYEKIRKRPFSKLLEVFGRLQNDFKFGINYVVNSLTIHELDEAIQIAEQYSASEFLLLPEVNHGKGNGIDHDTYSKLIDWVNNYTGIIPLLISEGRVDGINTCNPFYDEQPLLGYAHIDAAGYLKFNSYSDSGIKIKGTNFMKALFDLENNKEV